MSTQHTPGDWDICWDGTRYVIHDNTALQRHIAYTSNGGVPDDEARANARLFAAAPDMLKDKTEMDALIAYLQVLGTHAPKAK